MKRFFLVLLILTSCSRYNNGLRVDHYREDDAVAFLHGGYAKKTPQFLGIYVFETRSLRGIDTEIFSNEISSYKTIFQSTDPNKIDQFWSLLGPYKNQPDYSSRDFHGRGTTYHVLLPIKDTNDALFFRVYVPDGANKAAIRAGTGGDIGLCYPDVFKWVQQIEQQKVGADSK